MMKSKIRTAGIKLGFRPTVPTTNRMRKTGVHRGRVTYELCAKKQSSALFNMMITEETCGAACEGAATANYE